MKKKIIATTMLLPLILALAGCNKGINPIDAKLENTFLTPEILDKNIALKYNVEDNRISPKFTGLSYHNAESEKLLVSTDYNMGVQVLKDKTTDKITFYSLVHNKKLIDKEFDPTISYSFNKTGYEYTDFPILKITDVDYTLILDAMGHKLVESNENIITGLECHTILGKDSLYVIMDYFDNENKEVIYRYDKDGNFTKDDEIIIYDELPSEGTFIPKFEQGQKFKPTSIFPLDKVGHEGYYFSYYDSNVTLYNDKNESVNTFDFGNLFAIVGDKLIYITSNRNSIESKDYDFVNHSGDKINYNVKIIDYMTGKESIIEPTYFINSIKPYYDENGIYKYGLATIYPIVGKSLDNRKEVIIDENLNILQNVSGLHIDNLVKFGDCYYDYASSTILDKDLNKTTKFANSRVYEDLGLVNETYDGREILVDSLGKVKVDNNYSKIYLSNTAKVAICYDDDNNKVDLVSLDSFTITNSFTGDLSKIGDEELWYVIDEEDKIHLIGLNGLVKSFDESGLNMNFYHYNNYNDKGVLLVNFYNMDESYVFSFDETDGLILNSSDMI